MQDLPPVMTRHAIRRMAQRGIRSTCVRTVLQHGRRVYARGLNFSDVVNTHVVPGHDGSILTTYRNRRLYLEYDE